MGLAANLGRYARLWIIAIVWFALDQASKIWIIAQLPLPTYHLGDPVSPPVPVIEGFYYIVHVGNEGAAWGILAGFGPFLILLAVLALLGVYCFRRTLQLHHIPLQYAFGFLCGGIVGNLIDRLQHGHVVDFLDFHLPLVDYRWPAFNFADMGIVGGVLFYIGYTLLVPLPDEDQTPPAPSDGASASESPMRPAP